MERIRKNSQARIDASNKYRAKTYEQISLVVKKGLKSYYKMEATKLGYTSLNAFIIDAIQEKIKRGAN